MIDLWPKDKESGCCADMTRTYVVGDVAGRAREYHRLVQGGARPLVRRDQGRRSPAGRVRRSSASSSRRPGYQTAALEGDPARCSRTAFSTASVTASGSRCTSSPCSAWSATGELIAGEVYAVEPGLYRPGFGGCRLEDLALVTENGAEKLTDFPYDLKP